MVQTVPKQDTSAHLQDTTITTSPSTLYPYFHPLPLQHMSRPWNLLLPPRLQFFNFFACLPLGTLLLIHRHSISTPTTTPHHEKKQKLNDSLAIANDSTHCFRAEQFNEPENREHGTKLHLKTRRIPNYGFGDQ